MKNLLLAMLLTTISARIIYAADATADVNKHFGLKSSPDQTIKWLEANQKSIYDTLKVSIVEDMGEGKLKVKLDTVKGEFVWIAKETKTSNKDKYVYKSELVKSISGGIVYSDTYIVVSAGKRGGSSVSIRMSSGVNRSDVTGGAMTIDFASRINKCRRMIESRLD